MINYIIVFVCHFVFMLLRTYNIKMIAARKAEIASFISGKISLVSFIATAIGVKGVIEGDYFMVVSYYLGSVIATYIGTKMKEHEVFQLRKRTNNIERSSDTPSEGV